MVNADIKTSWNDTTMKTYKPRLTNEQKSVILGLHQEHGYGRRKIATITNINVSTVQRALREHKQHLCTK